MKCTLAVIALLFALTGFAQKPVPLPHGTIFGDKPDTTVILPINKVESLMGKRTRLITTVKARVLKVTKPKGGWFTVDAGNRKVIQAHFKEIGITLPTNLRGRIIIMQGVAAKQFIADDKQHFAGDTVKVKQQPTRNHKVKPKLVFEVKGLMVYQ